MRGRRRPKPGSAILLTLATACANPGAADRCEILSETVVRLGGDGEEGSFVNYPFISPLLGSGFYIGVSRDGGPEIPAVFDSQGRFLRLLGRSGDGPGEFRDATLFLRYRGDSALVLDEVALRASVLDRSGQYVRSFSIPTSAYSATVMDEGALALGSGRFGNQFPIAVVGPDGVERAQFDLGAPQARGTSTARFVARNGAESIWAVPTAEAYHFEQWTLDGTRRRVLKPARDWFISGLPRVSHSPTQPMRPFALGLWQDSVGVLWATSAVADSEWAEGLGPPTGAEGHGLYYPISDWTLAFDGKVEAMDTLTGALIASRRFDVPIFYVSEPGLVVQARATDDGWWKAELVRLRLSAGCETR